MGERRGNDGDHGAAMPSVASGALKPYGRKMYSTAV